MAESGSSSLSSTSARNWRACDNSRLSREESKRIAKRALAHARQFRAEVELSDDDPDSAIEDLLPLFFKNEYPFFLAII